MRILRNTLTVLATALALWSCGGDKTPVVIASTASPYKFAAAVSGAIGLPKAEDEFAAIEALNAESGVRVPYGLKDLKSREILHKGAIAREDMKDFVRETIKNRI